MKSRIADALLSDAARMVDSDLRWSLYVRAAIADLNALVHIPRTAPHVRKALLDAAVAALEHAVDTQTESTQ